MKIKILVGCAGECFSFHAGEKVDADVAIAKDLIDAGYAEEVDTDTKLPTVKATTFSTDLKSTVSKSKKAGANKNASA